MSIDADLKTVLTAVTPRVFPGFAPVTTKRPYVTYQQIGGEVINPLDGAAPGKRNAEFQIDVWSDTHAQARLICEQIEDAMRAATEFTARPTRAPIGAYEADVPVYGMHQDFSVWY